MAVGQLDIVNLALMRIGESPIQSMDEGSTPARSATLLYDISRRAVLRDYDWNFAIKTIALPVVRTENVPGAKFSYSCPVPSDCLRVVEVLPYEGSYSSNREIGELVFNAGTPTEMKFIGSLASGVNPVSSLFRSEFFRVYNGKIYTHLKHPIVKYVRDEENVDLFDSKFIEAFSYKLAGELAMAVRQSETLMASMLNAYQAIVSKASEESQNEHDLALSQNPYVEVRYGH
jgi:hypothetical protein